MTRIGHQPLFFGKEKSVVVWYNGGTTAGGGLKKKKGIATRDETERFAGLRLSKDENSKSKECKSGGGGNLLGKAPQENQ